MDGARLGSAPGAPGAGFTTARGRALAVNTSKLLMTAHCSFSIPVSSFQFLMLPVHSYVYTVALVLLNLRRQACLLSEFGVKRTL